MNEKPILFNTEMVKAVLDGKKTVTRRVIKKQPPSKWDSVNPIYGTNGAGVISWYFFSSKFSFNGGYLREKCPYGQPGDELWVREKWGLNGSGTGPSYEMYDIDIVYYTDHEITYAVPKQVYAKYHKKFMEEVDPRWHPSIHMPRWASRIQLEVLDVRIERVQDIDNVGAIDEGVYSLSGEGYDIQGPDESNKKPPLGLIPIERFKHLWDSINGNRKDKDGKRLPYSWSDNPYVWVVEFKVIEVKI